MDFDREHDQRVRTAAFGWLASQVSSEDGVVSRNVIAHGFEFGGVRVPLVSMQGIFKPQMMDLPLSITTSPNGPYNDRMGVDKMLRYKYRGIDQDLGDQDGIGFVAFAPWEFNAIRREPNQHTISERGYLPFRVVDCSPH